MYFIVRYYFVHIIYSNETLYCSVSTTHADVIRRSKMFIHVCVCESVCPHDNSKQMIPKCSNTKTLGYHRSGFGI